MKTSRLIAILSFAASLALHGHSAPEVPREGHFEGTLKLTPISASMMRVDEHISYNDGVNHQIDVETGFKTDGASIPQVLWSIVGSPFSGWGRSGSYVEAAVIHDKGCESKKYDWQTTHRMFYTAMLDSGVDSNYAKLLYYGVRLGGPRWASQLIVRPPHTGKNPASPRPYWETTIKKSYPPSENQVTAFKRELESRQAQGNPMTPEEIDSITSGELRRLDGDGHQ